MYGSSGAALGQVGQVALAVGVTFEALPIVRHMPVVRSLPPIRSLPSTGAGPTAMVTQSYDSGLFAAAVIVLAIWPLYMAGRAMMNMIPKAEA